MTSIGERIRLIRNLRGMTQKWLGIAVDFPEKTSDIRIGQYEKGSRTPKSELLGKMAKALDVSPAALNIPNIDNSLGVMHTLFALEDMYGLQIDEANGEIVLHLEENIENLKLRCAFIEWLNEALMLREGEKTKEDYDNWRYNFSFDCLTLDQIADVAGARR